MILLPVLDWRLCFFSISPRSSSSSFSRTRRAASFSPSNDAAAGGAGALGSFAVCPTTPPDSCTVPSSRALDATGGAALPSVTGTAGTTTGAAASLTGCGTFARAILSPADEAGGATDSREGRCGAGGGADAVVAAGAAASGVVAGGGGTMGGAGRDGGPAERPGRGGREALGDSGGAIFRFFRAGEAGVDDAGSFLFSPAPPLFFAISCRMFDDIRSFSLFVLGPIWCATTLTACLARCSPPSASPSCSSAPPSSGSASNSSSVSLNTSTCTFSWFPHLIEKIFSSTLVTSLGSGQFSLSFFHRRTTRRAGGVSPDSHSNCSLQLGGSGAVTGTDVSLIGSE
mmetsp:Transcript_17854/g.50286  ORF Transcript_17854/g.50286 Transcript_17854/m.50286 type:complete len:343 (+) Transcript_17854:100-1128(+)